MKKTYIIPQTEVFHTAASLPIATSDPNDVTIDTNSNIEAQLQCLGRRLERVTTPRHRSDTDSHESNYNNPAPAIAMIVGAGLLSVWQQGYRPTSWL